MVQIFATYAELGLMYIKYISKHYCPAVVVFDGHRNGSSTKDENSSQESLFLYYWSQCKFCTREAGENEEFFLGKCKQ